MAECTQVRSRKAGAGRSWLDAWLKTIPQNQIRTITTPDGATHTSVQSRPGATAEALRDAAALYHRRQVRSHCEAAGKPPEGVDSRLEPASVSVPALTDAPSVAVSSCTDVEAGDANPSL